MVFFFLSADDARNVGSRDCEEGIMVVEPTNQPTNQLGVKERRTTTTPRRNRWREKEKERVKRRKDRGGGSVF